MCTTTQYTCLFRAGRWQSVTGAAGRVRDPPDTTRWLVAGALKAAGGQTPQKALTPNSFVRLKVVKGAGRDAEPAVQRAENSLRHVSCVMRRGRGVSVQRAVLIRKIVVLGAQNPFSNT